MTTAPANAESTLYAAGGRLRIVPILHGRYEFAVEVRRAFAEHRPTHIAVELPPGLRRPFQEAVRRLPLLSVLQIEVDTTAREQATGGHKDGPLYALVEPTDGLVEAVRLADEHALPVVFADCNSAEVMAIRQAFPDPHAIESVGLPAYSGPCMAAFTTPDLPDDTRLRERTMAHRLRELLADDEARILFVCGLVHAPGVVNGLSREAAVPFGRRPGLEAIVYHLHPDAAREVLSEIPFVAERYESWRAAQTEVAVPANWPLARRDLHTDLIQTARRDLRDEGETISTSSVVNLFRFARNCSVLEGALAPDFYTLVLAARGVADDDFAWHVWNVGSTYEPQHAADGRPSLRITLADLRRAGRQVRFERRVRRRRSVLRLVRSRPHEARPGEWNEQWSGVMPCSYPPEDLVIEGYGRFLAHKARGILAADQSRTEPFTTSLLDGIDFRETIRNLTHDGRVWVRRQIPVKGEVGAVVVAFDPEDREARYSHRMTWQGEHDQESDMALYSTPPEDQVIGPGIARCEYGGFLLTWPPGRMYLVWEDPEFAEARTPAERLLMAGIDYALDRMVVYVAPSPPRSFLQQYATRRDRRIVHVPIGQLSPPTLKRVRVFHVLDGRQIRSYAREFIW